MRRRKNKKINYERIINNRFNVFFCLILFFFTIVSIKLIKVMVVDKKTYDKSLEVLTYTTVSGTSSPRGRIYDRNYNILVDNKSLKTITYQKRKGTTNKEMIDIARVVSSHIDLDYHKITERNIREFVFSNEREFCDTLVTE